MIELRVNSQTFFEYKSLVLTRSINKPAGAFSINLSPREIAIIGGGQKNAPFPVKVGDLVQILVDDIPKLTGYIDSLEGSGAESSHELTFSGRDTTQDLIDSAIPPTAKNIDRPLTLLQFCTTVIAALGAAIPVTDKVGTLPPVSSTADTLSGSSAGNCMAYLTSYARKVQAYLIPDGIGGLQIFRPTGITTGAILTNRINDDANNIKSWSFGIDYSNRYRKYVCKSQDNFSVDQTADYTSLGTNRSGTVTDTDIRVSRYTEIQGEQTLNQLEVQQRINEEANLRRIKSNEYTCTVQGFSANNGVVWDIGQAVKLSDSFAQKEGVHTITDVTYTYDTEDGSTTQLRLSDPDAFRVLPLLGNLDAARSGQNNPSIKKDAGYPDNDYVNRGQSVSINDTFNEQVGE